MGTEDAFAAALKRQPTAIHINDFTVENTLMYLTGYVCKKTLISTIAATAGPLC